jgi:hypothetical protein
LPSGRETGEGTRETGRSLGRRVVVERLAASQIDSKVLMLPPVPSVSADESRDEPLHDVSVRRDIAVEVPPKK